ncbi:MAG: hypothetical protein ACYC42_05880 [Lysobacter sp.]
MGRSYENAGRVESLPVVATVVIDRRWKPDAPQPARPLLAIS